MATLVQRTRFVVVGLVLACVVMLAWQTVEHVRVRRAARVALVHRAKDISDTLGLVLRAYRRFGGVISRERVESAIGELIRPDELSAVALLNAGGEVVASAGAPIDLETRGLLPTGEHWDPETVTLLNLIDLGTNVNMEAGGASPTIVLPRERFPAFGGTNRPGPPIGPGATNRPPEDAGPPPPPPEEPRPEMLRDGTNRPAEPRGYRRSREGGRPPFGRPFWMTPEEYKAVLERQGVHSFVIVLSTKSVTSVANRDLWLRTMISALATLSAVGLGLAWRTLAKSSELEVRLVRAAELNTRLKEMNLAAAGLAHETRNPLNIIRGLAQMISRHNDAPAEIRKQSRDIIDETDRVTAQLNEFINYSRPREVRRSSVGLGLVAADVVRALTFDLEEKSIGLRILEPLPVIEADEQLLRQALFNLLLNAIQAVDRGGNIEIAARRDNGREVTLEIRDDGPGVPAEQRLEIFKPYFTTHQKGTGLGLAIVQQIVLAHGWEIECAANTPRGAVFRLAHIKPVAA